MFRPQGIPGLRRTRGFTLSEVMIASAIASLIMLSVMALQFITARTLKELYGPTRSRTERNRGPSRWASRNSRGLIKAAVASSSMKDSRAKMLAVAARPR